MKFVGEKLMVSHKFQDLSEVQEGDIIEKINNELVSKKLKELYKYCIASNRVATMRNLRGKLMRTNNDSISLTINRNGKKSTFSIPTIPLVPKKLLEKPTVEIKEDYAYLNTNFLQIEDYQKLWPKIKDKKRIIIDLRCYPEVNLPYYFAPYFFKDSFTFYRSSRASLKFPGNFYYNETAEIKDTVDFHYSGEIIVLVDENTQSKAEFSALAFVHHPNAIILGSQTAGTDGSASEFIFPGNVVTHITTTGIFNLDMSNTQKIGVPIDILVEETLEDIKNKKDAALMKAMDIILK